MSLLAFLVGFAVGGIAALMSLGLFAAVAGGTPEQEPLGPTDDEAEARVVEMLKHERELRRLEAVDCVLRRLGRRRGAQPWQ